MDSLCKKLCIMLIFSVCSIFVLVGFIFFDHIIISHPNCECDKCNSIERTAIDSSSDDMFYDDYDGKTNEDYTDLEN